MTPAERTALAFFAAVAALGAGARAAGLGDLPAPVAGEDAAADDRRALDRQLAAVDSARASRRPRRAEGRQRRRAVTGAALPRPAVAAAVPLATHDRPRTAPPSPTAPVDVDRADSAALEALPGVGPALARRIVADRSARGPVGTMAGLRRVAGIGPRLEGRLRPLVTFSGPAAVGPPRWPP